MRGLSYADLRHGPIAVVGPGVTAILVAAPDGPMLAPMIELAGDLAERGAHTLAFVVPAQLVVEALARRLGLDPDAPRGLSKVTATDPA